MAISILILLIAWGFYNFITLTAYSEFEELRSRARYTLQEAPLPN